MVNGVVRTKKDKRKEKLLLNNFVFMSKWIVVCSKSNNK